MLQPFNQVASGMHIHKWIVAMSRNLPKMLTKRRSQRRRCTQILLPLRCDFIERNFLEWQWTNERALRDNISLLCVVYQSGRHFHQHFLTCFCANRFALLFLGYGLKRTEYGIKVRWAWLQVVCTGIVGWKIVGESELHLLCHVPFATECVTDLD